MEENITADMSYSVSTSQLEQQQKAIDVLDRFTLAHAGSRLAGKRFGEAMRELREIQSEEEEEKLLKYAKRSFKGDKKTFDEMSKLIDDLKDATGDGMKKTILKVYKAVFNNIRHRTLKLSAKTGGGQTVSVGPYGFGIVYSVQAKPVLYFEDMAMITKASPEICKSLRDHGGRLKKWAKVLEKFVELTPDLDAISGKSVEINLSTPVLIPKRFDYNDESEPPFMSEKMKVHDRDFAFEHPTWDEEEYEWSAEDSGSYVFRFHDIDDFTDAVLYLQVKNELPRILEKVKEAVVPNVEKSKDTIRALQETFGRELLFEEI